MSNLAQRKIPLHRYALTAYSPYITSRWRQNCGWTLKQAGWRWSMAKAATRWSNDFATTKRGHIQVRLQLYFGLTAPNCISIPTAPLRLVLTKKSLRQFTWKRN